MSNLSRRGFIHQAVGAVAAAAAMGTTAKSYGRILGANDRISLALAKLRGNFANIHISENDPATIDHLPIGDGAIDWREFFRVLKNMNYDGYLGLDLGLSKSLRNDYRKSIERLKSIAAELRFPLEI